MTSQSAFATSGPIGQEMTPPRPVSQSEVLMNDDILTEELDDMLDEDMTPDISDDIGNSSYVPECEEVGNFI